MLTIDPRVGETRVAYSYASGDPVNFTDPTGETDRADDGGTGYVNTDAVAASHPADVAPPLITGDLTVENPNPIVFKVRGETNDIQYDLDFEINASMTIEGGSSSAPSVTARGSSVTLGFRDLQGNVVSLKQSFDDMGDSISVKGKGVQASVGSEKVTLAPDLTGIGYSGSFSREVDIDGQKIELEDDVSVSVTDIRAKSEVPPPNDIEINVYGIPLEIETQWDPGPAAVT